MTYHSQSIAAQENSATGNNTNAEYRLEGFGEKSTFILAGKTTIIIYRLGYTAGLSSGPSWSAGHYSVDQERIMSKTRKN